MHIVLCLLVAMFLVGTSPATSLRAETVAASPGPLRLAQASTDSNEADSTGAETGEADEGEGTAPDAPDDTAEDDTADPEADEPAAPAETEAAPQDEADGAGEPANESEETDAELVLTDDEDQILRSPKQMPEPVRRTWQALVNTARSGNVEGLRLLIDAQPSPPIFAFSEVGDPIDYLKSLSGDAAGREMLAILLEILETGFVHVDRGTPQEMYLWPYFARYPLARLTPSETVEMFTILTAGDYQDMLSYGAYIFFRVGIGPDGTWHFFVAGD